MSLATYRSILLSPSRSAATTPSPRPCRVDKTRLGRHIDKPAVVIAENMIGRATENHAACNDDRQAARRVGRPWDFVGHKQVVADVKIEVAVAVQVGKGRRGRPVAIAGQPGLAGDVLKRSVALGCDKERKTASA